MKDFRTPRQRLTKPSKTSKTSKTSKRDNEGLWTAVCVLYAILLTFLFVEFLKLSIF